MKKGSNVVEYAILVVVVGLLFGYSIFNLMIDQSDGSNRIRKIFSKANQADDTGTGLTITIQPTTD